MTTEPVLPPVESGGEPVRLAKRVAALFGCSRSEAEHYIEGGWVRVDGEVVELPQFRVGSQTVTLAPDASLSPLPVVTLIYHRPATEANSGAIVSAATGAIPGADTGAGSAAGNAASPAGAGSAAKEIGVAVKEIGAANRAADDRSGIVPIKRHFSRLIEPCPLEAAASGLVVLTQDGRIVRKLSEEIGRIEQEIIVEVRENQDSLAADGLKRLNHGLSFGGQALPPCKVSWQNETRLRFAIKNPAPGQIADMCSQVGLAVVAIKRIRIGRLPMAGLPAGQWRYLGEHERF